MAWSSGGSSTRASPYPSPSASPRPGYGPLPGGDYNPMAMGRMGMGLDMGLGLGMAPEDLVKVAVPGQPEHKIAVSKVNVTTPSTIGSVSVGSEWASEVSVRNDSVSRTVGATQDRETIREVSTNTGSCVMGAMAIVVVGVQPYCWNSSFWRAFICGCGQNACLLSTW